MVLEGRDRIGGRTYTDEDGLDMGAHWIHSSNKPNPVRELVEKFGLTSVKAPTDET